MREFNITGLCMPAEDYMVDISDKLKKIAELVKYRQYFVINRARQYGKTTTLAALERMIKDEYIVVSISFEGLGDESFATSETFCKKFMRLICRALEFSNVPEAYRENWLNETVTDFTDLDFHITRMCEGQKVVLLIDEVDKTCNNRMFLHFLSMLRSKYLSRKAGKDSTFHSVILAGVYDIKNIKLKIINEGGYSPLATEGVIYNSPWNIASEFSVDMSFSAREIESMLNDYQNESKTCMDVANIAFEIHKYTDGYPFLVSYLCKIIDEELGGNWSENGVKKAVNIAVLKKCTLLDDLTKNLENHKNLYDTLYSVLIVGETKSYVTSNPVIEWGEMFGYIKNDGGNRVVISNKIFEIFISDYFISKDSISIGNNKAINGVLRRDIVENGKFNMELCLRKFADHYLEILTEEDKPFLERHGRLLFLSYIKPLINGQGFYHIESQFTDLRRMDIVVDFGSDQFIVELKLWKGEIRKGKAYKQLLDYMDTKNADKGYLLTFDFRKEVNRKRKNEWVRIGDKMIFEVII